MLTDKKLSDASFIGKNVKALPDNPSASGITAKQLKAAFDRSGEEIIATAVNGIIEEMIGVDGASNIGKTGFGTVQDHIGSVSNPHSVTASQIDAYTKSETDVQINNRIVDIGSADMKKAIYDTQNKNVDIFGYVDTHKDDTTAHVITLTHTKLGTAHTLTGSLPSSGYATIRFKATADFVAGDTFKLGTTAYTAKPTGEAIELPDKAFIIGDVVTVEIDIGAKKINFKLGGGGSVKYNIYSNLKPPSGFDGIKINSDVFPKTTVFDDVVYGEGEFVNPSDIPPPPIAVNTSNALGAYVEPYLYINGGSSTTFFKYHVTDKTYTAIAGMIGTAYPSECWVEGKEIHYFNYSNYCKFDTITELFTTISSATFKKPDASAYSDTADAACRINGDTVWGFVGRNDGNYRYKQPGSFSYNTKTFEAKSLSIKDESIDEASTLCYNNQVFIFGGYYTNASAQLCYSNALRVFDVDTQLRTHYVTSPFPNGRYTTAVYDNKLYIHYTGTGLYVLNPDTITFTFLGLSPNDPAQSLLITHAVDSMYLYYEKGSYDWKVDRYAMSSKQYPINDTLILHSYNSFIKNPLISTVLTQGDKLMPPLHFGFYDLSYYKNGKVTKPSYSVGDGTQWTLKR